MTTSETGCYLVALSFFDFLSSRNDSFLDNIAPQHINVLKSLSEKKNSSGWSCGLFHTGNMDVLVAASQCTLCLSHSLETQGQFHIASGIYLELFLLTYIGD